MNWGAELAREPGVSVPPATAPACLALVDDANAAARYLATHGRKIRGATMAENEAMRFALPVSPSVGAVAGPLPAGWERAKGSVGRGQWATQTRSHQRRSDSEGHPVNDPDPREYADPADWARALAAWSDTQPFFDIAPAASWETGPVIRPPGPGETVGSCADALPGSDSACGYPQLNSQTVEDLLAIDPEDYRQYVQFGDDPRELTAEEQALFLRAWGVIMANDDLLAWATCWAFGKEKMRCLRQKLGGSDGMRVRIKMVRHRQHDACQDIDSLEDWDASGGEAGSAGTGRWDPSGGHIWVCDNVVWRGVLVAACSGYAPSVGSATLAVAMLLAHELTHVCDIGDPDSDMDRGRCYHSYRVAGVFGYALGKRYGFVRDPDEASYCGYVPPGYLSTFWGSQGAADRIWPWFLEQVCVDVSYSYAQYVGDPSLTLTGAARQHHLENPCG